MRKQRLLKNLNCRGKALAILLTVTASLLYCGSAWATFEGSTYYFDNTQTKWAEVYMIIGKDTYAQARQMTETDCSGIYSYSLSDWSDATKFFFAESTCGFSTTTEQKSIDTTPTCENYTAKITSKPSNFIFVPSASAGTNIGGEWVSVDKCVLNEVLKGDKIMFYIGEYSSWSQNKFYLTKNNAVVATAPYVVENDSKRFGVVTVAATTGYYITHDSSLSYAGHEISGTPVQGGAYYNTDESTCKVKNGTALTASVEFTNSSITVGSNATIDKANSRVSNGILGLTSKTRYYATTDNETFTELTAEVVGQDSILQTSGLAAGTWTIIPVFFDGYIYCKGTTTTLTVALSGDAPTVLLAAAPEVSGANATLHGYLKYTGCQDVTAFGFIWSETESDINQTTPTGTSTAATSPSAPITVGNAGTEFSLSNYEFTGQTTIYYKAYATNIKGTSYSTEYGSFTTQGCAKPKVTSITLDPSTICDNAGTITATATAIDGATYAWTVDGTVFTGTVASITNVATITVSAAGTGSISVTPTITSTSCVGDPFTKSNITVKNSTITANNLKVDGENTTDGQEISFCEGQQVTFKITSDYTVSTYTWSFPTGWTTVSGAGTEQVVVTAGSGSGNVTATITNDCGVSASRYIAAKVTAIPAPPGKPGGAHSACRGASYEYTVTTVSGAEGYEWVLPTGWTGECSGDGNTITATASMSAQSGTIKVRATNDCGESAYSDTIQVTVGGVPVTISGSGAKSTSATYPWEIFTLTATTDASSVTWNTPTYTGTIADDLTVFTTDAETKTAKLKSGAPVSDIEHYTVTVKTNVNGCEVTSDGYDVYINADVAEDCGE